MNTETIRSNSHWCNHSRSFVNYRISRKDANTDQEIEKHGHLQFTGQCGSLVHPIMCSWTSQAELSKLMSRSLRLKHHSGVETHCCFSPAQSRAQRSHSSPSRGSTRGSSVSPMVRRGPLLLSPTRVSLFAPHLCDPHQLWHLRSARTQLELLLAVKRHCVLPLQR